MSVKLQHQYFISSSSSNAWLSHKLVRTHFLCNRAVDLDRLLCSGGNSRKRCLGKHALVESSTSHNFKFCPLQIRKHSPTLRKSRKTGHFFTFASAEDGVTINGTPQTTASGSSSDVKKMSVKLNQSLQGEDYSDGLVQSLHDAARVFELAIKDQSSLSKTSWLSTAWLGVDKNAWVKALSYQASVYSLLQAAIEVSSRGDGRDRDLNVFVQRSLLRQSAPLESIIRDKLLAKQPEAYDWFWSEQVPLVVTTFVDYFERDPRFIAATAICRTGKSMGAGNASDISLLMLALTCIASITKLGPAKISCPQFFSMNPDITGRLMDMLVDFIPIPQAYHSIKEIGLRREFLLHFGPRAAACRLKNDRGTEEVVFWVDLVQKQLQRAIDREKIWSRLTTCESIEVLERDLAIFGFFIALGRRTQSFLYENSFDVIDDPLESFIRYLIGGSVLYYPQLSSISSYQLYVEVVCEELDWLPFYPGNSGTSKQSRGHRSKPEGPPNAEAIPQVLEVCSYWMQSFIKYSKWPENPSNVKATRFLSRGHNKLTECMEDLGILKKDMIGSKIINSVERTQPGTYSSTVKEPDSFDKALESVEEALIRLEELLQQLHVSSSNSGKEHLKAACSDLEKIRKLKKEAEFLEASFRAKAASLQQGDDDGDSKSSVSKQPQYYTGKNRKTSDAMFNRSNRMVGNTRGLWSFVVPRTTRKLDTGSSTVEETDDECFDQTTANAGVASSESNEIDRFELLRNELIELEKRVQRSTDPSETEVTEIATTSSDQTGQLVHVQKKEDFIGKSLDKLKETSTDVLQGTQLLAIDVGAALGLLRRSLIGDELTEKEKQAVKRTLTDLASVVPIGVLMLLPVTAVGHAAMLAAIQRYIPSLIPSTYGPERLDLLRQLEKMKEMQASEVNPDESAEEIA